MYFRVKNTHIISKIHTFSEYETGDLAVDTSYTMVCPSGYQFYIYSAYYGYSSTCTDTDALANLRSSCHGQTTSCTAVFGNTLFGDPCTGGNSVYTKVGRAEYYCASEFSFLHLFNELSC